MQNRYTGDIGDFGKYGLLRALTASGEADPLRLGVVWYLTPPEDNRDGQQRNYLRAGNRTGEQLRQCDSNLFTKVWGLEPPVNRHVSEVRLRNILPTDTEFHEAPLNPRDVPKRRGRRIRDLRAEERERWHQSALETTRDCQVVFLDPDNGIEPAGLQASDLRARKYALYGEIQSYLDRGQSVVVYHHLNRSQKGVKQIHRRQLEVFSRMRRRALAMRYHRGSPRAFILIPQAGHRAELMDRIGRMMEGPWARHFSMIG